MQAKTLGLSMIVKNESHVLTRLLNSVAPIIDYWVIADTGSTDGTQELITNFFKERNIPGELIQIEWKDDFSYARNVALNAIESKTDYGFWIDADEELILESGFDKEKMLSQDIDSISVRTVYGKVDYTRKNIWKTKIGCKWEGPIHELLSSPAEKTGSVAVNAYVIVRPEGSSWGNITEKYSNHAEILAKYTETNTDPRWVFYTAQSYRDASMHEKSIEWYRKRAEISAGFLEEVFISRFMIAKLSEIIGKTKQECTILYQEAHAADPFRGEAIKSLVQMYQRLQDWENAYVYSLYGLRYNNKNPYPHRILFLDKSLYEYEMLELHSLSCFYTKRTEEGSVFYWALREQLAKFGPSYLAPEQLSRVLANEQYFPKTTTFAKSSPLAPSKKSGGNFTPKKKKR